MKLNILIVKFYYIKLYATSKMFFDITQHCKYLDRNNLHWQSRNIPNNDFLSVEELEYITGVL